MEKEKWKNRKGGKKALWKDVIIEGKEEKKI